MKSEEDKITEWFAKQSKLDGRKFPIGIGDDMAMVDLGGDKSFLVTTDILLEGVHFNLSKATLEQVGYKSMAVSLSDCAAMATKPIGAVAAVALPRGCGASELKKIHKGISIAADKYNCPLVGGDITSWKSDAGLAINITMFSSVGNCKPVKRSGAMVDDVICVTGFLGGSDVGKHLDFTPRVFEALAITSMVKVNSMMDLSDGLSNDLPRICRQSKVGALIEGDKLPISVQAMRKEDPLGAALNDGEDFELLFTLSKKDSEKLFENWEGDLRITPIGEITNSGIVEMKTACGLIVTLKPKGYDHLGGSDGV